MAASDLILRRTTADDWAEVRELRLEMLAEAPLAFLEHLADAERQPESEWRARAARGSDPGSITLVAVTADGRWAGTMRGYVPDAASGPMLATVYVRPAFRGRDAGVTDALLTGVEEWALTRGRTLTLEVNEANPRARAAYASRGFVETGHTRPYPLDPSLRELEMRKWL